MIRLSIRQQHFLSQKAYSYLIFNIFTSTSNMYGRITILFIISPLLLTTAVNSDFILKCYICTSAGDEGCGNWLNTSALQTQECTPENINNWKSKIHQHTDINKYMLYLGINNNNQQSYPTTRNMACAKMVFRDNINKDVIIRTCLNNRTDFDICATNKKNHFDEMQHCSLCFKEACNGTTALSFEIFNLYLAFLIFILFACYR